MYELDFTISAGKFKKIQKYCCNRIEIYIIKNLEN
jgi:hypothetical protein